MSSLIIMLLALVIDWLLGEPKRWHPLVGFGKLVQACEQRWYRADLSPSWQIVRGGLIWLLLILPITLIAYALSQIPVMGMLFTVIGLYLCIGHKSLYQHVMPIIDALNHNDKPLARELTGEIVSRDTETLNIANASIESVLENGNDAVFAALFWFLVAGLPGVIALRLINTLDAMWGYKNSRYLYFGRVAARMDDLVNIIPARLTALSYALLGKTRLALTCWHRQAALHDSPNAGPVMASGAGALSITIGGPACYQGEWHQRPVFGAGSEAKTDDIKRALHLVSHSVVLWLLIAFTGFGVFYA
jgi:adenosylcobinamide-phosphate synthase